MSQSKRENVLRELLDEQQQAPKLQHFLPPPLCEKREESTKFDRNNTYYCSEKGVVPVCGKKAQAVTIAS